MSYLYLTGDKSPLTMAPVTPRADSRAAKVAAEYAQSRIAAEKAGILAESEPDNTDAQSAYADAVAARDALAVKAKGTVKFIPREGVKVHRWLVTDEQLAAYLAEGDAKKRRAMFAVADAVTTESPVHPNAAAFDALVASWRERAGDGNPRTVTLADLAAGQLIVPTVARGANAKGSKRLTEAEKQAAALVAMFGPDAEPDAESDTEPK